MTPFERKISMEKDRQRYMYYLLGFLTGAGIATSVCSLLGWF